ncbi:hypothetical protein SynBIOSE41_04281 [Synechococcus sp. BIOS-E4-1]|uniref:hypothetical protein n=1 Tax=Synechococcus sp. BIOS-E4-1 TaxID=1400864 RepID=UPI00164916CC|nr:hypothetical protein [Synechococcus sp. BIOS-E4-1]QNI56730.1 hypothetical protein SynBIOSE41_04281 [Synechococcus sp. BIOS-E4-1]
MWIGRILLLGVGSSYIARWILSPQRHRSYVAACLKALHKTSRWLPRGRHTVRRLGRRTFRATLKASSRRSMQSAQSLSAR